MYVLPHTRSGWWALWLLLPVLLYPLYWSVFLLLPAQVRAGGTVVVALGVLILVSTALAAVAIIRGKDRSVLLITVALGTLLLVLFFAVGELIGH